jgi:hypothetical protein
LEGQEASKIWTKWKQTYLAVYTRGVNHKHTWAMNEPFSHGDNLVTTLAVHKVMDGFAGLLDNLTLAATSNKTTVQQLTSATLALTS